MADKFLTKSPVTAVAMNEMWNKAEEASVETENMQKFVNVEASEVANVGTPTVYVDDTSGRLTIKNLKGETGAKGTDGSNGIDGSNGTNGADGYSITGVGSTTGTKTEVLNIKYTDGDGEKTYTTGNLRGSDGKNIEHSDIVASNLQLTFDDGQVEVVGKVVGDSGANGDEIAFRKVTNDLGIDILQYGHFVKGESPSSATDWLYLSNWDNINFISPTDGLDGTTQVQYTNNTVTVVTTLNAIVLSALAAETLSKSNETRLDKVDSLVDAESLAYKLNTVTNTAAANKLSITNMKDGTVSGSLQEQINKKVETTTYDTDKTALELSISKKVLQTAYDTKMTALDASIAANKTKADNALPKSGGTIDNIEVENGAIFNNDVSFYTTPTIVGAPVLSGIDIATQTEAETGTNNTKVMTPLRVKESIEENKEPSQVYQITGFSLDDIDGTAVPSKKTNKVYLAELNSQGLVATATSYPRTSRFKFVFTYLILDNGIAVQKGMQITENNGLWAIITTDSDAIDVETLLTIYEL